MTTTMTTIMPSASAGHVLATEHGLAHERAADLEGNDLRALADEGGGSGVGGEGVREQQQQAAEERRCEHRDGDATPVGQPGAAEGRVGLRPLRLEALERRHEGDDHERHLEVDVEQQQAGYLVNTVRSRRCRRRTGS